MAGGQGLFAPDGDARADQHPGAGGVPAESRDSRRAGGRARGRGRVPIVGEEAVLLVGRSASGAVVGENHADDDEAVLRLPGAAGRPDDEPGGASDVDRGAPRTSEGHPDGKRDGEHPGVARHRHAQGVEGPGDLGGFLFHRHPAGRIGQVGRLRREPIRGDSDGALREGRQGADASARRDRPGIPHPLSARGPAAHGGGAVGGSGAGAGVTAFHRAGRPPDQDRGGGADGEVVCAGGQARSGFRVPHPPPRLRHAHVAGRGRRAVDPAYVGPRPDFHDGDLHDGANHRLESGA